ncbi:hypothetical protein ABW06_25685 [Pluralibacter gergoviae]|uniref:Uncharacterized protein n=1 Tax=Pluralibacter gergoviae TaxID=61647 RepID=A0A0J5K9Z0_PLUGE|nr:hypothetical protein JG24_02580 [Klebsiella variicola]KMK04336.1 hypothetical protein ABW06_25685 [Pluralibacter gergoviae]
MTKQCFSDALSLISRINIYRVFNRKPISMAFAVTRNITVANDGIAQQGDIPWESLRLNVSQSAKHLLCVRGVGFEATCTMQDVVSINIAYRSTMLFFSIDNMHRITPVMMFYKLPEFATVG